MRAASKGLCLGSLLALGACAVAPPTGPTVMALPGQGKAFPAFRQDDYQCRQYAAMQTGGASPAQAATNSAVGSAALGTALGAGVGAALGSVGGAVGTGAAIGGATGLLAGSAIGAGNAQAAGMGLQQRYDIAYTQCMYGHGDRVEAPPPGYARYPAYGYGTPYYHPYYGPGYYPYYAPGYYDGPSVSIGVGGGWGWGGGWHHHHHW